MKSFKKLWTWAIEGRFLFMIFFLFIGVILVTYIDIGVSQITNIRIYGLILQIIGAIVIIQSLKQKLILFRGHGIWVLLIDWLKRFPFFRKGRIHKFSGSLKVSGSISAQGEKSPKYPDENNPSDIIRYFDEKMDILNNKLVENLGKLNRKINELNSKLVSTTSSLEERIDTNYKIFEDSSISSVWRDLFGVCCIIIGLTFSTTPELIIKLTP